MYQAFPASEPYNNPDMLCLLNASVFNILSVD